MLVLRRKLDQSIIIGDGIEVTVVEVRGDVVKLGVNAPKDVTVYRKEVYESIQKENLEAARSMNQNLPELAKRLKSAKDS